MDNGILELIRYPFWHRCSIGGQKAPLGGHSKKQWGPILLISSAWLGMTNGQIHRHGTGLPTTKFLSTQGGHIQNSAAWGWVSRAKVIRGHGSPPVKVLF